MKTRKVFFFFLIVVPFTLYAVTVNLTQSGYAEGAVVNVSFTGVDSNFDTQITENELSAFSMTFSGNSVVPAFSLGLGDLWGFVYDDNGGPLGDGLSLGIEGIGANDGVFSYEAGPGPVAECGVGIDCAFVSDGNTSDYSNQLLLNDASVPVPVSSAALLLLLSLLLGSALLYLSRKKIA